jgi:hypothetical protein
VALTDKLKAAELDVIWCTSRYKYVKLALLMDGVLVRHENRHRLGVEDDSRA